MFTAQMAVVVLCRPSTRVIDVRLQRVMKMCRDLMQHAQRVVPALPAARCSIHYSINMMRGHSLLLWYRLSQPQHLSCLNNINSLHMLVIAALCCAVLLCAVVFLSAAPASDSCRRRWHAARAGRAALRSAAAAGACCWGVAGCCLVAFTPLGVCSRLRLVLFRGWCL